MKWPNSVPWLAVSALLTVLAVDVIRRIHRSRVERKGYPLPPGPIALPFLGSVLAVNSRRLWLTLTEWQGTYGDIIYVRMFDMDFIALNSVSVATELLDKRSRIYSDRYSVGVPSAPFDFHFGFAPYGDYWRLCRRIFQRTFRGEFGLRFRPMQLRRARQLVLDMIDDPTKYPSHVLTFSTAVAVSTAYGYEISPQNDPMISILGNFHRTAVPEMAPEKLFLLKAFPVLLYMPDWLPGSWVKRDTEAAYECRNKMVETPYGHFRDRLVAKDRINISVASDYTTEAQESGNLCDIENERALKDTCSSTLEAAQETTSSTLTVFMLAMVQNPHVWKRAQADIDAVVGTDRLPEFTDRPSLTYVDAIIREVLRWRPVLPVGGPHAVTQSDIYNRYYIPKGAVVLVNTWAISRDEVRYPDAEKFLPERFIDAEGILTNDDPSDFVFGFGRRRCPGSHVADASVWSVVATMLATLDFHLARDANGNDITFEATFTSAGTEQIPQSFPLSDHPSRARQQGNARTCDAGPGTCLTFNNDGGLFPSSTWRGE